MLKPGWPGSLRRTVGAGKKARTIVFDPGEPVVISADDMKSLRGDVGVSLYEIDRDEKNRPRFVETMELEPSSVESV